MSRLFPVGILAVVAMLVLAAATRYFPLTLNPDGSIYDPPGFFATNAAGINAVIDRSVAAGGTGATNAANARSNLGLGSAATNDAAAFEAAMAGGNSSNFHRGDGVYAQVTTNDIPGLNALIGLGSTTSAYELTYGTNTWRQVIVGTVSIGGFDLPVFEWQKTTNAPAGYYFDLGYLGDVWRTSITNVVVAGGFEFPVMEHRKL